MSAIVRMTRFGRIWRILLDCGHTMERSLEEAKAQQLYIDKRVGCRNCEREAQVSPKRN